MPQEVGFCVVGDDLPCRDSHAGRPAVLGEDGRLLPGVGFHPLALGLSGPGNAGQADEVGAWAKPARRPLIGQAGRGVLRMAGTPGLNPRVTLDAHGAEIGERHQGHASIIRTTGTHKPTVTIRTRGRRIPWPFFPRRGGWGRSRRRSPGRNVTPGVCAWPGLANLFFDLRQPLDVRPGEPDRAPP